MNKTIFTEHADAVCEKLIEIRSEAKLTQRGLAAKLNRAHSFIGKCELGERRIDIPEFRAICKACGVSPHEKMEELLDDLEKLK